MFTLWLEKVTGSGEYKQYFVDLISIWEQLVYSVLENMYLSLYYHLINIVNITRTS